MSEEKKPLDPAKVVCVIKNQQGVEVGRVAANAPNAEPTITNLTRVHGSISVEYVENEEEAKELRKKAEISNAMFKRV
jgi:hypothetical protein